MKKDLEIWRFAAAELKRNESTMLIIVAESAGSSPGRQGFKMAIAAGETRGSIGGGAMEIELVKTARVLLDEEMREQGDAEKNGVLRLRVHRKNSPNSSGMICSGRQTVIFYKLNPADLPTVQTIICTLEKHESKILQITPNELCVLENQTDDFDFRFERRNENDFLYGEKLGFKNKLSIVGGGHCALALSEMAAKLDFHVSLFDDRAGLNTFIENRFAHAKTIVASYENIGDFVRSGANQFVVVMTVGYQSDEVVIRKLFDKNFKYFGVLGSGAKIKTLLKNLEKEGFDQEKLNRIRAPIGLKINSRTPEEIAVSIAAEIIRVKNARD